MSKFAARSTLAVAAITAASTALASGDSGTGSVTEMQVGPGTFFALLGGVVGMGVLVWLLLKVLNRPRS